MSNNYEKKMIEIFKILDELTDDERKEIIDHYCQCGSKDIHCQCWNDE